MNIDINGVSITLTNEQLQYINKKLNKSKRYIHYTDIKSLEDAINLLESINMDIHNVNEYSFAFLKLSIIIKAINILIDNDVNFPSWCNENQKKHYPIFKINNDGVVCFYSSTYYCNGANGLVGFYKSEEASKYAAITFIKEYSELILQKY